MLHITLSSLLDKLAVLSLETLNQIQISELQN